jgi:sulfide:quinone oxidoreductase
LRSRSTTGAPGATLRPRFKHALTLDDSRLDEQLHGLIQDVEGGSVHELAFISPTPMPWPLGLYELALMTAKRADDANVELSVTLATPEAAPLAVFGSAASPVRRAAAAIAALAGAVIESTR